MPSNSPEDVRVGVNEQDAKSTSCAVDGLACNGCRKSKLRCSRDRPSCAHCRKTGLDCIYETKRIKPGLKAGAVENIHRRLDDLERRITDQETTNLDPSRPDGNADKNINGSTGESAAQNILLLLAQELPKLIHAPKSHSIATPASSERSNKRRRLDGDDVGSSGILSFDDTPLLPEPQTLEAIVTAYFFHVHPWIPMIHQTRFIQRFRDETEQKQLHVILHAMIIAASKFVPGAWAVTHAMQRARHWVVYTAMDRMSLESLQALIILAFNDIGSGNAAKAWSVIGSLTRTVEYTQLAQEQEDGEHRPFCQPYASLRHTDDWTEVEERRRVFWNVFLLDRFCSATMGWNTSLTSDDVYRRLPCDGHLWRKQKPVVTPYFGIWDKSKGRIGNPIGSVSRYPSPTQSRNDVEDHSQPSSILTSGPSQNFTTDMSTVGALAYNIEAMESMSRVMSYFLQQKINIRDHNEIGSWLTRFKELDLRLVHWKMLLPQRWKANPNLTRHVPLMDPNLTTAHVTHNASMILLHQLIAYPPIYWGFRSRLPSSCSAEACYCAGVEIATITEKYLGKSPAGSPIGSQYAFCLFIAARVLLAHWRYTAGNQLSPEFWSLMQSLEEMSRRWTAYSEKAPGEQDLFTKYAGRLKELYELCATDESYQINVMDYTNDINHHHGHRGTDGSYEDWPEVPDSTDFNTMAQIMLDQNFMGTDRVIAFDDGSMFTAPFESGPSAW
ncbi:fungal-specific transcription factor domain-containing protein [Pyrenochaeta sp. MPI-SDFR-AT-0127]|nr:fungal-specific transcription factor domain-containing protein [Pyrenochaeta sp. MPI-SDFR-AT-0127]